MLYANLEIIRPLYGMQKKISSELLKAGNRFIFSNSKSLMFKTNSKPENGNFLCCDEEGNIKWLNGDTKVIRINGIRATILTCSIKFKNEFLKQDKERQKNRK